MHVTDVSSNKACVNALTGGLKLPKSEAMEVLLVV
jgi:hypothetical protein